MEMQVKFTLRYGNSPHCFGDILLLIIRQTLRYVSKREDQFKLEIEIVQSITYAGTYNHLSRYSSMRPLEIDPCERVDDRDIEPHWDIHDGCSGSCDWASEHSCN